MTARAAAVCLLLAVAAALTGCTAASEPTPDQRADAWHYVQTRLDDEWRGDTRFDRPSPVASRFLLPNGWAFAMSECMKDAGYLDFDFSVAEGFTNGDDRAARSGLEGLAWYSCGQQLPTYDTVFSEPTDDELDMLYDYYRERLIPCLALEGTAVPSVPTRGQFGDGGAGRPGWWNPYLTARQPASTAVAAALLDSCPPYPPGWSDRPQARP